MGRRELDELQDLLGRVLRRIDSHAGDLLRDPALDLESLAERLEDDTEQLQLVLDDLLAAAATGGQADRADLNATVVRCVQSTLDALDHPLVLRQHLQASPAVVPCRPGQLGRAVQRALDLAAAHAGHGGEISIRTATQGTTVRLEITCDSGGNAHLTDRALTLREFVADLGGTIDVGVDRTGALRLCATFPMAIGIDG